jgi:membrane-associated phospholipid phosphatase
MQWLQNLDITVFRFLNGKLVNPIFDQVMPLLSGNVFFYPAIIVLACFVIWKYRGKGIIFFLLLALAIGLTDGGVCRAIKHAIGRERPFTALADVRCLLGQGGSASMPSSHAANWFAATMVAFVFYRRSLWIMLPLAMAVSFSRVYCGVHYPSDVLAGAILGAGTAAATLWLCTELWIFAGRRWFPLWWERFPVLMAPPKSAPRGGEGDAEEPRFAPRLKPGEQPAADAFAARHVTADQQWLRLGYLVIAILLVARLLYIASDVIQLSPEEALQWLRSRHIQNLQLPDSPLGFFLIWAGTLLFGDRQFGVRVFAPVLATLMGVMLLRFLARSANARSGFFALVFVTATPMLAEGGILMQGDFLRAFWWTAGLACGWRALQSERPGAWWVLTGLCAGLVSFSKQATLFPLASLLFLFVLSPAARRQLKKPGPWLALLVCVAPIAITIARPDHEATHSLATFSGTERWPMLVEGVALLNPIFLIFGGWAAAAFWRRNRHNPLLVYCFCMSVPALLFALVFDPGWAAPAAPAVALLCLMTAYWDIQARVRSGTLNRWLSLGLILGLAVTLLTHQTDWVGKLSGRPLPVQSDPLAPLRGWRETGFAVQKLREELAKENKPVFVIAQTAHLAGELSYYLPEAKATAKDNPQVYISEDRTGDSGNRSGFFGRKGENAIFASELRGDGGDELPSATEARLRQWFESAADLGAKEIKYHGQVLRRFRFFACRNLQ